jgi:hypothetical protein
MSRKALCTCSSQVFYTFSTKWLGMVFMRFQMCISVLEMVEPGWFEVPHILLLLLGSWNVDR